MQNANEGTGWYIDNVAVKSCQYKSPPGVSIQAYSREAGFSGETIIHSIEVTNTGPEPEIFTFSTDEFGWETEILDVTLGLAPNGNGSVRVKVTIPMQANAGEGDRAALTVSDQDNPAVQDTAILETYVILYQPRLDCKQPHLSGWPGGKVNFSVTATNEGTVEDTITLLPDSIPNGWRVDLTDDSISLQPGQYRTIPVSVIIPAGATVDEQVEINLRAISQGNSNASVELTLTVTVEHPRVFLPIVSRVP